MIKPKQLFLISMCALILTNISYAQKRKHEDAFPLMATDSEINLYPLIRSSSLVNILAMLTVDNTPTLESNLSRENLFSIARSFNRILIENRILILPQPAILLDLTHIREIPNLTNHATRTPQTTVLAILNLSTTIREFSFVRTENQYMPLAYTERITFLLLYVRFLDAQTNPIKDRALFNLLDHLLTCIVYAYNNLHLAYLFNSQSTFSLVELPFYELLIRNCVDLLQLINTLGDQNTITASTSLSQTLPNELNRTTNISLTDATAIVTTIIHTLSNILPPHNEQRGSTLTLLRERLLTLQRMLPSIATPNDSSISPNLRTAARLLHGSIFVNPPYPPSAFHDWLQDIPSNIVNPNPPTLQNATEVNTTTSHVAVPLNPRTIPSSSLIIPLPDPSQ